MSSWLSVLNLLAFFAVLSYVLYLFTHIVYSRYLFIKLGKKVDFKGELNERLNELFAQMFGHKKLMKDKKSGIMHFVMFYGFIILQFGALDLIGKGLTGNPYWLPFGSAYPYFVFMQEITVLLILLAVGYAGYRRFIEKLPRLKRNFKSSIVIILLSSLMLTVLMSLGFEAVMLVQEGELAAGFYVLHPVSSVVALAFGWLSLEAATVLFYIFWWAHNLVLLTFLLYVPQSKHFHIFVAPINIFFKRKVHPGKLSTIDFEDESAEEFGVGKVENFTQKQMIDLYACVECGRCTNMCPAAGTGKMLSPMDLITKIRDHLTDKGAAITSRTPWMPVFAFSGAQGNQLALAAAKVQQAGSDEVAVATEKELLSNFEYNINLIGDVITEEEIWACTTCRNCEDQCPVMNEHVDKIIDMRRYLVLTEGKMATEAQRTFNNIERQSNPWGINRNERINWRTEREDIHVPTVKEVEEFDVLWFVGSMGSFDNRNKKVAHSFAKIMNEAGVKFAILGNEEKNSGDTARRMGNEFLFQQLCQENIEIFQKYGVKKIVSTCPHTFNTLKNEYPEFGLEAEVLHHTELIAQLLKEGKIKPTKEVKERITFHDSCYLGRYNNIYELPREILQTIPGVELAEMDRNREDGMCCGAGGGMMWLEETEGKRVNIARTEQALAVNPTMISSGCPYCLTMMGDGTKALEVEEKVATKDIVEILEMSLEFSDEKAVH
ncbi:heterodisulfide reductase-related iron-sulfur binding cluster [Caldalkalibacillus mannanilyticus]|uniref:heterodisulfide reductase-related iron-sulfur binding cluster n=1 Tax=Caldalkalibacillus mannanilyticus TaxID=1418 RepID=UPI00046A56A0|nr:heterodisulfide reductase-related iron-sulfur binding cluster [Caldalkalibacillus mannanilyticus]